MIKFLQLKPEESLVSEKVSKSVEQIIRAVIAKDRKGWSIVGGTMSSDGDTATVEIVSLPIRNVIRISLKKKKIEWSQG